MKMNEWEKGTQKEGKNSPVLSGRWGFAWWLVLVMMGVGMTLCMNVMYGRQREMGEKYRETREACESLMEERAHLVEALTEAKANLVHVTEDNRSVTVSVDDGLSGQVPEEEARGVIAEPEAKRLREEVASWKTTAAEAKRQLALAEAETKRQGAEILRCKEALKAEASRAENAETEMKRLVEEIEKLKGVPKPQFQMGKKADKPDVGVPTVLLKAVLDGKEVHAMVVSGLESTGRTTPVKVRVKGGEDYAFGLVYEDGENRYVGRTTVRAKFQGLTEDTVELKREPSAGATRIVTLPGGAKMKLVWCPSGSFWMEGGGKKEKMQFDEGFWIGQYEVTQEQWESVMGRNPSDFGGLFRGKLPVENVSGEECLVYCREVKAATGLNFRLPTAVEWEYACRAGSQRRFGGTGILKEMGWTRENSEGKTHPVGKKKPNAWGVYDMHGNVWEWCADVDSISKYRVVRGGGFNDADTRCESGHLEKTESFDKGEDIGFRIVCSTLSVLDRGLP